MSVFDSLPTTPVVVRADVPLLDEAQLAAVAFLARYRGRTLDSYRADLRQFFQWAATAGVPPLKASRAHIELYRAWLDERGLAASTVDRRLSTGVRLLPVRPDRASDMECHGSAYPADREGAHRDTVTSLLSAMPTKVLAVCRGGPLARGVVAGYRRGRAGQHANRPMYGDVLTSQSTPCAAVALDRQPVSRQWRRGVSPSGTGQGAR
jgi:Phage integrase, N-terminal SAM-like domain